MGQPQQLSDFSLILLINFRDLIHLVTIEAPVEGELGKVCSSAPEVAIGSDGKTYNPRQAKPAAHVVTGGRGPS